MKVSWTKGLDKDLKEEVTLSFKSSSVMRKRLKALIEEKEALARKQSISKETYESPSWGFLQADNNGYLRALHEILSLIEE